jgi:hypothetical protein
MRPRPLEDPDNTRCAAVAATQQRSQMTMSNKKPESKKQNKDQRDFASPTGQARKPDSKQQPGKKSNAGKR